MPYYRMYGGVLREIDVWTNFAGKDNIVITNITTAERDTLGEPGEAETYALCDGVEPLAWNPETEKWENFFTVLGIPVNTGPKGDTGEQGPKGDAGEKGDPGAAGANGTNGTNGTNATVTGYQNTTLKTSIVSAYKSATVSSGIAVFQLTADGLSTGSAIFPNEVFGESIQLIVNDATASYQFSWVFTNSNKTLTVTANKLGTANILTGILGQVAAPNGTTVNLTIKGR